MDMSHAVSRTAAVTEMTLDEVEATTAAVTAELLLGIGSSRRYVALDDFVEIEFAAFGDDDSVVETIRRHFATLAVRHGWLHQVIPAGNSIVARIYASAIPPGSNRPMRRRDSATLEF